MKRDYAKLGLKAGLECHQQLDTGKLFCRCPSTLREDKPDLVFERKLRPVPSELGEYDPAALEAFRKGLSYVYEAYSNTTCLIEADEEPPKPVDGEALKTVLEVALLTGADVLDKLFVMRKAVIDGSNTSGFQKTMLVATGGSLKLKEKRLGIQTIVLEEDAARPMEKNEKQIIYRLDRLGIPLIELATEPGIKSPEEAREAALAIGNLFRLTGRAKRGLGSIRQDVNISIAKGARVEIKGVQQLDLIDEYVRREVERQLGLVEIGAFLKERGIKEKDIKAEFADLSPVFASTQCKVIKNCRGGCRVLAVKLPGFRGLIGKELQPGRRFGTELADYAKARAGLKGLFHSDELPNYGITEKEVESAKAKLKLGKEDAFAMVCAEKQKAEKGLEVVVERCRQALRGVPEETRNALDESNTQYSRPLPGAARMYPETDLDEVEVDEGYLKELRKGLPLAAEERKKLYTEKFGLSGKLAEKMKLSNWARSYKEMVEKGYNPTTTAVLLLEGLVQLRREGVGEEKVTREMIEKVLEGVEKKKVQKEVMLDVLKQWSGKPGAGLDEMLKDMKVESIAGGELERIVRKVVEKNRKLVKEKGMQAFAAVMGDVMKEAKGKASGQEVSKAVKEEIERVLNKG